MKRRCSPYNPAIFLVFLGIFIFYHASISGAQCQGEFHFESVSSGKQAAPGKIEITFKDQTSGQYTLKVYKMDGIITLVQTKQASAPEKITFENLSPATYFVKIEWGQSCSKTLGGMDGITITEKDKGR
jgi:hypothetical protein